MKTTRSVRYVSSMIRGCVTTRSEVVSALAGIVYATGCENVVVNYSHTDFIFDEVNLNQFISQVCWLREFCVFGLIAA